MSKQDSVLFTAPFTAPFTDCDQVLALERRFSRLSKPSSADNIVFEFTNDPALLAQYFMLRGGTSRTVQNDAFDSRSHILILRKERLCVGGVRLTLRSPRMSFPLPMEVAGVSLRDAFPEFSLPYVTYGELTGQAFLNEYQGLDYQMMVHEHVRRKALAVGMEYVFMRSSKSQARHMQEAVRHLRDDQIVLMDIKLPFDEINEETQKYVSYIHFAHTKPQHPQKMTDIPASRRKLSAWQLNNA
ncbi:MAG: hypothetical protein K2Q12_01705 [Rickettsiales bacterium]|nr:hypothetical protein [Rickettsiales bacterium]